MNPAPIKIVSRYDFEHMDLDGCPFAISIREADETELSRPSYKRETVESIVLRSDGRPWNPRPPARVMPQETEPGTRVCQPSWTVAWSS